MPVMKFVVSSPVKGPKVRLKGRTVKSDLASSSSATSLDIKRGRFFRKKRVIAEGSSYLKLSREEMARLEAIISEPARVTTHVRKAIASAWEPKVS